MEYRNDEHDVTQEEEELDQGEEGDFEAESKLEEMGRNPSLDEEEEVEVGVSNEDVIEEEGEEDFGNRETPVSPDQEEQEELSEAEDVASREASQNEEIINCVEDEHELEKSEVIDDVNSENGNDPARDSESAYDIPEEEPVESVKAASNQDMNNGDHTNDFQESFSGSPVPPQLVSHPLRDEAPLNQSPSPIVASHPVVKTLNSSRKSGDQVWPPVREEVVSKNPEVSMSPLMRPKKVSKDYNNFFNQNAIPKTFPSYRAPPGTQHFTAENNGITQH